MVWSGGAGLGGVRQGLPILKQMGQGSVGCGWVMRGLA